MWICLKRNLTSHLFHVGSQLGVRRLVDLVVPVNRDFNPLVELKDDHGVLQVSTRQDCV